MKRGAILLILTISAGLWIGASSARVKTWWSRFTAPKLPAAENAAQAIVNTLTASLNLNTATITPLPSEKNLAVPFTSQAPNANWDADHEEFCEEASMLMVGRYYQGRSIANAADAEQGLQAIQQWELDHLGFFYDTTVAENAQVIEGLYGLKVQLKINPTIDDIKRALADGHPVIVPAAGRELGNPNFTAPGPIYHNLVIRGYTQAGQFITNDPGTRKGEQYVYDQAVLMAAIHDWVPNGPRTTARNGDVAAGRRVVLIVMP